MRWLCVQDFGLHVRGDFVELPDDAEASPQYFVRAPEDEGTPTSEEVMAETPANATDEARGATEPIEAEPTASAASGAAVPENFNKKDEG